MRLARLTVLLLAFAALPGAAGVRAQRYGEAPPPPPVFEFHSGFWINLHHFLYEQGRIRRSEGEPSAAGSRPQELASLDGLTAQQQQAWNAAVDVYVKDWSSRDLLLNGDMAVISNRLAELENCTEITEKARPECQAGLRKDLVAALNEAAPVYRARWWPEQDRENRAWINDLAPMVRRMGVDLSGELAAVYQGEWPRQPIRVDVVWSAGPLGAYTTLDPAHVTIASDDARNQGRQSFEVLFHQAARTLSAPVSQAIARECRELGKPIPRDLWQAISFYTVGELARRVYANSGADSDGGFARRAGDAVSDDGRNGSYDAEWNQYRTLLELYWQPYLDGRVDFDTSIARMISAL